MTPPYKERLATSAKVRFSDVTQVGWRTRHGGRGSRAAGALAEAKEVPAGQGVAGVEGGRAAEVGEGVVEEVVLGEEAADVVVDLLDAAAEG